MPDTVRMVVAPVSRSAWEAPAGPRTGRVARRAPWPAPPRPDPGPAGWRQPGAGAGRDEAFATVRALAARGLAATLDHPDHLDPAAPPPARDHDRRLAAALGGLPAGTWLALDLGRVGLEEGPARCRAELAAILDALPVGCWLQVGTGDPARAGAAVDVVLALAEESAPLVATVPATLRRSAADARLLAEAEVPVRLVEGTPSPPAIAHPWGPPTDLAYARLAAELHGDGARVLLATRRAALRDALLATLGPVEVELPLAGPRAPAFDPVTRHGPTRVAVPLASC